MDTIYLVALNSFPKFGQKRLSLIKKHFGNWRKAFESTQKELVNAGLPDNLAHEFIAMRQDIDLKKLERQMQNEGAQVLELGDKLYPPLLSEIYDPPALLFYKGDIKLLSSPCIAIVGTRKNTFYGQQAAIRFASSLSKQGFTIVSGLALGIDSIAHSACLENNGRTIAVLGSGVDRASIYPASNRYLAAKIIERGGLICSEFPLGTQPQRYNFPLRNRIIAGLSQATIVVEAAVKSGALITATCAMDQNREVFAVPGSIFSEVSLGPNSLLKQGASLATSVEELLDTLDLKHLSSYIKKDKIRPESKEEEAILSLIGHEPLHIDEIKRKSQLSSPVLSSTLTLMEMRGIIRNLGGMRYVII